MWCDSDSGLSAAGVLKVLALTMVLAVASMVVGGCASMGSPGLTKETATEVKQVAVGKRAEERWQAIIRGDFERAYAYFTPASRQVVRAEDFATRMGKFPYRAANVDKVECVGEVCTVSLTLTYDNPAMKMKNVPTLLKESWLIESGQAWFVYRA